jgi:hypothetical protein
MHRTFDLGWFFGGIAIAAAGILIVKFHRLIADNLASGIQSYNKVKLFGVVTTVLGFIIMANLHSFLLSLLVRLIFPN